MEKQKVAAYVEFADAIPYCLNYIPPNTILHWRIYITPLSKNKITSDNYWVVCGKSPEDAIKRFESFSNYYVDMCFCS